MTTLTSISEIVSFYNILIGPVTSFKELQGRMLSKIVYNEDDEIHFHLTDTHYVSMHHDQDCCECVYIEDIVGDLDDLIGTTLLLVEEVNNYEPDDVVRIPEDHESWDDSETWTYYRFSTEKGDVSIRWYGSSNGYYSESVDIEIINQ
tara:strand:- start:85 stop:528 length:444 start_codon:yes stop_codon:yes gene_type:complete